MAQLELWKDVRWQRCCALTPASSRPARRRRRCGHALQAPALRWGRRGRGSNRRGRHGSGGTRQHRDTLQRSREAGSLNASTSKGRSCRRHDGAICPTIAPALAPPRHRHRPRFLACLTPAAASIGFYAGESGNRVALPNHACLGRGAGGLCEGGACTPWGGVVCSTHSHLPACCPACPSSGPPSIP